MQAVLKKLHRNSSKRKPAKITNRKKEKKNQEPANTSGKKQKRATKKKEKSAASKRWTSENTSTLIDMVEERSCLWAVNDKDYHNKQKRAKALEEIESVIGVPPNEIKTKLTSLRAQLGREMAKVSKVRSGQSADDMYKSTWAYWDRLQFLKPVITPRNSVDSLTVTLDDGSEESQLEINNVEDSPSSSSSLSQLTPKVSKRQQMSTAEDKKQELLTSCINILKEPTSKPKEKSECHFASYIAQRLELFDKRTRVIAEKRITDVLFDLEMNDYFNNENLQAGYNGYNNGYMMQNNQGVFTNMMQQP
eukprot:gene9979-11002_t